MKTCQKCGCEMNDDMMFCPKCGTAYVESSSQTESSSFCPYCGQSIQKGQEFCPHCGTKLHETERKPLTNPYNTYAIVFMICSVVLQELVLPILAIVYGKKGVDWCKKQDKQNYKAMDGYMVCKVAYIIGISKIAIVVGVIFIALMLLLAAYLNGTIDALIEDIKELLDSLGGILG